MVIPFSLAPKPEPVTVTEVPAVPLFLLMEKTGPTLKEIGLNEEEEVIEPWTLTAWAPPDKTGIEIVLVHDPAALACTGELTGFPSIVTTIPCSPEAKPEPLVVTEIPADPLVLLIVKLGVILKEIPVTEAAGVLEP